VVCFSEFFTFLTYLPQDIVLDIIECLSVSRFGLAADCGLGLGGERWPPSEGGFASDGRGSLSGSSGERHGLPPLDIVKISSSTCGVSWVVCFSDGFTFFGTLTLGYLAGLCQAFGQVHLVTPGYRSGYRRALVESLGWFTLWNAVPFDRLAPGYRAGRCQAVCFFGSRVGVGLLIGHIYLFNNRRGLPLISPIAAVIKPISGFINT
jgi:hypothetical protein